VRPQDQIKEKAMRGFRGVAAVSVAAAVLGALAAPSAIGATEAKGTLPDMYTIKNKTGVSAYFTTIFLGADTVVGCTSSVGAGVVTTSTLFSSIGIVYSGCEVDGISACTSPGASSGEVTTKTLHGALRYISAPSKTVGLEISPTTGTLVSEFSCLGGLVKGKLEGCVIGQVTPINTVTTTLEVTFNSRSDIQEYTKTEGGPTCELAAFGGKVAYSNVEVLTFAKSIEIKA
jgi:hypothetical protein